MPKDWKDIEIDEILNFDGPQTGQMARYDRIMRQREIEVMGDVSAKLFDLKRTIHQSGENLDNKITEFNETINRSSESLNKKIAEFDESQGKLQKITIILTIVIALSTLAYTLITWQSVKAQREANEIQRSILESNNKEAIETPSNNQIQVTPKSGAPD